MELQILKAADLSSQKQTQMGLARIWAGVWEEDPGDTGEGKLMQVTDSVLKHAMPETQLSNRLKLL